jgi:ABC-type uncharacterized transport system substrate-binding protein
MTSRKFMLFIVFLFFTQFQIHAHPHMSITTRCSFTFEDMELTGVWVDYRFDKYFSMDILQSFDLDQNKTFDPEETLEVYNNAFINLENYGFFISIRDGDKRSSPQKVSDFSLSYEDNHISYRFFMKLEDSDERQVVLSVFDPTYFCSCTYEETDTVRVISDEDFQFDYSVKENKDYPVYYDPYAAVGDDTTHDFWFPGLETAYPEEIHFVY